jgi:ankyrin repeat protein
MRKPDGRPVEQPIPSQARQTPIANRIWGDHSHRFPSRLEWGYAGEGDAEAATSLLEKGAEVDAEDWEGFTALTKAAMDGHLEIVQVLLQAGADPDAKDQNGRTSLMWGASCGNVEAARYLLYAQVDVNATDSNDWTAPRYALDGKHVEVADLLRKAAGR